MATFDDSEITDLAEILGTNSIDLSTHLGFYEEVITDTDKISVLQRVTAYQAVEDDDLDVYAKEKNYGAQRSSDKKRSLIQSRIAKLLHWQNTNSGSRLVRC
jgi:hypothetical protein